MKTPHAILIGLSLIAAAIFFKDIMTSPAHALGGPRGFGSFSCSHGYCFVLDGNVKIYAMIAEGQGGAGKWK